MSKYKTVGISGEKELTLRFTEFIQTVRANHPNSKIIMAYGAMTDTCNNVILNSVKAMNDSGDENVYSIQLPKAVKGHPIISEQAEIGKVLADFITGLENPEVIYAGDIDGDQKVNLLDVTTLAKYVAKWKITVNEKTLDTDNSGSVNLDDVTTLARYVAKWSGIKLNGDIYPYYKIK